MITAAGRGAGGLEGPEARKALAELYRRPIDARARRAGHSRDAAGDLIHGFVESIVASNALVTVPPELGRFRNWLKARCDARKARTPWRGAPRSTTSDAS